MSPVDFPESNGSLLPPAGVSDKDCAKLPVCRAEAGNTKVIISCWQPTPKEIEDIKLGKPVWFWLFGTQHPPIAMTTDTPFNRNEHRN